MAHHIAGKDISLALGMLNLRVNFLYYTKSLHQSSIISFVISNFMPLVSELLYCTFYFEPIRYERN